jgi:hypothetical protein
MLLALTDLDNIFYESGGVSQPKCISPGRPGFAILAPFFSFYGKATARKGGMDIYSIRSTFMPRQIQYPAVKTMVCDGKISQIGIATPARHPIPIYFATSTPAPWAYILGRNQDFIIIIR